MREVYDFSNAIQNLYVKPTKMQIAIDTFSSAVTSIKDDASETVVPCDSVAQIAGLKNSLENS